MRLGVVVAIVLACSASQAMAANARRPYSNVDPRNDAGNETGDSRVEELNRMQLDRARGPAPTPAYPAPGYGYYAPPPGYYPPPPVYYPPVYPHYYAAPYGYYR